MWSILIILLVVEYIHCEGLFVIGNPNYGSTGTGISNIDGVGRLVEINAKIERMESGSQHSCLITKNPVRTFCFGRNQNGQVGSSSNATVVDWVDDLGLDCKEIGLFGDRSACFTSEYKIYHWGEYAGRLPSKFDWDILQAGEKWEKIFSGASHSVILTSQNRLLMFGSNRDFQLGSPDTTIDRNVINLSKKVKEIVVGESFTFLIDDDGDKYIIGKVGKFVEQEITKISELNDFSPMSHVRIMSSRRIVFIHNEKGYQYNFLEGEPVKISFPQNFDPSKVRKMKCGTDYCVALVEKQLYSFSLDDKVLNYGQLSSEARNRSSVVENVENFSVGNSFHLNLINESTWYGFGSNQYGQLGSRMHDFNSTPINVKIPEDKSSHPIWKKITSTEYAAVGLTEDYQIYSWGYNVFLQLGLSQIESPSPSRMRFNCMKGTPIDITSTIFSTAVLSDNGRIYAWGDSEIAFGDTKSEIENGECAEVSLDAKVKEMCSGQQFTVALANDRKTLFIWGRVPYLENDPQKETIVFEKEKIKGIFCGAFHIILLSDSNTLYCFGKNEHSQCGTEPSSSVKTPSKVPIEFTKQDPPVDVSAGGSRTLILTKSGDVFGFGGNENRELRNANAKFLKPEHLSFLQKYADRVGKFVSVRASDDFNIAETITNKLVIWGSPKYNRQERSFLIGTVTTETCGKKYVLVGAGGSNVFFYCQGRTTASLLFIIGILIPSVCIFFCGSCCVAVVISIVRQIKKIKSKRSNSQSSKSESLLQNMDIPAEPASDEV